MTLSLVIVLALLLDAVTTEPRRWHPLVGFGYLASTLEKRLNREPEKRLAILYGSLGWLLLVLPFVFLMAWLEQLYSPYSDFITGVLCLSFAIGAHSLVQHARTVSKALVQGELAQAREKLGMMVSRDTHEADKLAVIRGTIESVLENGNDAIFAALFWFIVLGAPGVILYRLANTLDAMWGYRTDRFIYFGRVTARIDDVLNYIPARLTAISYALLGNTRSALSCWIKQAGQWKGVNPGVVMASGAGALGVSLGGMARYHGENIRRPQLGGDVLPETEDIERSIMLQYKTILLWVFIIILGNSLFVFLR